jgi:hypothetical protein
MHGHTILLDSVPNGLLEQSYIIIQGINERGLL